MKLTVIRITESEALYVEDYFETEREVIEVDILADCAGNEEFSLLVIDAHNSPLENWFYDNGGFPQSLDVALDLVN